MSKIVLGLNCYHADSSACILNGNKVIAAVEEERFNRIKHFAGFPINSINFCLREANIQMKDIDLICLNTDPKANLLAKTKYLLKSKGLKTVLAKAKNKLHKQNKIEYQIKKKFNLNKIPKIYYLNHHDCHHYSSYFASKYNQSASLSIDGFGDFVSTSLGYFKNNKLHKIKQIYFPHSLGIFYTAITQFLNFKNYGDEYKVMGLAAYGKPKYKKEINNILIKDHNDFFKLNLKYFNHHKTNKHNYMWDNEYPKIKDIFTNEFFKLFKIKKDCKISDSIKADIAASAQFAFEEILLSMCNFLYEKTNCKNLLLSGGCAMNTLANGKILNETKFKKIFIQPAAADNGGALGSAYLGNYIKNKIRAKPFSNSYLGPKFSDKDIIKEFKNYDKKISIKKFNSFNNDFYDFVANLLEKKKVIGWFQDRMEWGARALGNRSIIADPRKHKMKDIINKKIKFREKFRPFAPIIIEDEAHKWFQNINSEPYMMKVYNVIKTKSKLIEAVVHEDGTSRTQTVNKNQNIKIYNLLKSFKKITNVPILINTSLNENEPIICKPKEAFELLIRTNLDYLVMSKYIFKKKK
jgi:carbamoyltransferase